MQTSPERALWRHRKLLAELMRREIALTTRGTWFGALWLVLSPLALLAIYTFVFAAVLTPAAPAASGRPWVSTGLMIFAALIPFGVFTDVLMRSPLLILTQPNYVKKTVFPVELFPAVRVFVAAVFSLISLALLLGFEAVFLRTFHIQWLLAPVIYLPLILLCLGLGWFLSSLGVYLRDTAQLSGLLASVLMFLTPVFYPLSAVPASVRPYFWLNPLTVIVESFRRTLVFGEWPDWSIWGLWLVGCWLVYRLGYAWFRVTRRGFADVV